MTTSDPAQVARRSKFTVGSEPGLVIISRRTAKPSQRARDKSFLTGKGINKRTSWNVTWDEVGELAPWFDALWLCDVLSTRLMQDLRRSFIAGMHPGTGAPQPPLAPHGKQGARARDGKRPKARGNTGNRSKRAFINSFKRTKIRYSGKSIRVGTRNKQKIMGTSAVCVIKPSNQLKAWIAREGDRGHEYFDVPKHTVDKVLREFMKAAIKGRPSKEPSDEEQDGSDV